METERPASQPTRHNPLDTGVVGKTSDELRPGRDELRTLICPADFPDVPQLPALYPESRSMEEFSIHCIGEVEKGSLDTSAYRVHGEKRDGLLLSPLSQTEHVPLSLDHSERAIPTRLLI